MVVSLLMRLQMRVRLILSSLSVDHSLMEFVACRAHMSILVFECHVLLILFFADGPLFFIVAVCDGESVSLRVFECDDLQMCQSMSL